MADLRETVSELINQKPEAESVLRDILEVDSDNETWTFNDIEADSGLFGEIVSRGIVERTDGEFFVPDRSAVRAGLEGDVPGGVADGGGVFERLIGTHPRELNTTDIIEVLETHYEYVIVVVVAVLGLYLRLTGLAQPPLLDGEALVGMAARSLATDGTPMLPAGHTYNRGDSLLSLAALSIRVFGQGPFAIRIPSVLAGTASIPLVYFLGRYVQDWRVGGVAATLQTFSLVTIAWSRIARFYALFQFLILAGIVLYLFVNKEGSFDYDSRRWRMSNSKRFFGLVFLLLGTIIVTRETHKGWILLPAILGLLVALPSGDDPLRVVRLKIVLWMGILFYGSYVVLLRGILIPVELLDLIGLGSVTEVAVWEHPRTGRSPPFFFFSYYPVLSFAAILGMARVFYRRNEGLVPLIGFVAPLFFFTMFGPNFRPIWRPRYLTLILPYFFVLVSIAIVDFIRFAPDLLPDLGERLGSLSPWSTPELSDSIVQNLSIAGVLLLVVSTPLVQDVGVTTDPYHLSLIEEPQPNYRGACEQMSGELHTGDVVITNRPQQLHFWMEKTDYRGNTFTSDFTYSEGRGHYTGAPMIASGRMMRNIVQRHDRVWVVYNRFLHLNGEEWVRQNLELYAVVNSPFPSRFPHGLYASSLPEYSDDNRVYIYTKGINETNPSGTPVTGNC